MKPGEQINFSPLMDDPFHFIELTPPEIIDELRRLQSGAAALHVEETISLEEFFDGNTRDDSIAPNLTFENHHPGIDTFSQVLFNVREQSGVADVRVGIHEWPDPDEPDDDDMWIAAEHVFFWVEGLSQRDIERWIKPLKADGVCDIGTPIVPKEGPNLTENMVVYRAVWD